jgi:hypothetical protein
MILSAKHSLERISWSYQAIAMQKEWHLTQSQMGDDMAPPTSTFEHYMLEFHHGYMCHHFPTWRVIGSGQVSVVQSGIWGSPWASSTPAPQQAHCDAPKQKKTSSRFIMNKLILIYFCFRMVHCKQKPINNYCKESKNCFKTSTMEPFLAYRRYESRVLYARHADKHRGILRREVPMAVHRRALVITLCKAPCPWPLGLSCKLQRSKLNGSTPWSHHNSL